MAVLLIVALVGTSGWIASVDASYEAQPGDFSYTVLRAAQKTHVAVYAMIGDKNTETKLHMQFANSIATKTRQLVKADGPKKGAQLTVAMADLKSELNSVNSKLDDSKNNGASDKLQGNIAKDVKQNTEQIKDVLQEVKIDLLSSSTTVNNTALAKEVSDTKDLVKDVSVKAVGVMVDKLNSGDKSVSIAEVKQVLDKSLTAAATEVVESKQTVEGIKTSVETVNTEFKDLPVGKNSTSTEAVSAAKALNDQLSTAMTVTNKAAADATAVTISVDQKITEAAKLLNSTSTDALAQIVTTLADVNKDTKQAEKISDNTLLAVQTVLPVVPLAAIDASSTLLIVSSTVTNIVPSTTLPKAPTNTVPIKK